MNFLAIARRSRSLRDNILYHCTFTVLCLHFGFTEICDACRERLRNILETACSDIGIPLILAHVVDRVNRSLFSHAAGSIPLRDASGKVVHRKTKVDDVFALLGATQLVTAIGALQLVAKGYLDLDDPSTIKKHLPELTAKPIFVGVGKPTCSRGALASPETSQTQAFCTTADHLTSPPHEHRRRVSQCF